MLDACAMLHRDEVWLELTLAGPPGSAGDDAALGRKIRTRGLNGVVRYVGTVRGAEKENLLRSADVYLQPSHNEGMPISLLEALAHGLPVIATRVGAVPEVLTHEREGLLIPPHRPDLLSARVVQLDMRHPSTVSIYCVLPADAADSHRYPFSRAGGKVPRVGQAETNGVVLQHLDVADLP